MSGFYGTFVVCVLLKGERRGPWKWLDPKMCFDVKNKSRMIQPERLANEVLLRSKFYVCLKLFLLRLCFTLKFICVFMFSFQVTQ